MRISEIEEEMRHRERTIRNLEEQITSLQAGVDDMSKELELKGKEILRIRSEANQAAKLVTHHAPPNPSANSFPSSEARPTKLLMYIYVIAVCARA